MGRRLGLDYPITRDVRTTCVPVVSQAITLRYEGRPTCGAIVEVRAPMVLGRRSPFRYVWSAPPLAFAVPIALPSPITIPVPSL